MERHPKIAQGQFTVLFIDRNTGIVLDSEFRYWRTDSSQSAYTIHNSLKKAIQFAENTKRSVPPQNSISLGYYIRDEKAKVVLHTDNLFRTDKSDLKSIVIDGENFETIEGFYDEIDKVLTSELNWATGHNLNALNDLLRGGFGVHEYEENIEIIWEAAEKSKRLFSDTANEKVTFSEIVSVIKEHKHIDFIEK